MLHIGTCGFPVSKSRYVREFSVVEVQKTFYTPMREETAKRWRDEVPENFEFTLKAPQTITHPSNSPTYRRYRGFKGDFGFFKNNEDVMISWENFVEIAKILKAKIVIFQSPARFRESEENIRNIYGFFESIERNFIFGWEPRGKWNEETVKKICEDLNLIHVVDPFKNRKLHGNFSYFRLHGITGYRYKFTDEDLMKLKSIVKDGDYVMFNNTHMWEDAQRFKSLLLKVQSRNSGNQQHI